MKKLLLLGFVLLTAFLVYVFAFIPNILTITKVTVMKSPEQPVYRYLYDSAAWEKWFPTNSDGSFAKAPTFSFNKFEHNIQSKTFNGLSLTTTSAGRTINGKILTATISLDSIAVYWKYQDTLTMNPIERVKNYLHAMKLKKNITTILDSFKAFIENKDKVYGIKITETDVIDTVLISIKKVYNHQPSQKEIYEQIALLEAAVQKNGMRKTDVPRYFIASTDSGKFQSQFAIPVEKIVGILTAPVEFKRMIAGRILVSDVTGSESAVNKAFKQMSTYVTDYQRTSPAIPFYSLVTDRRQEPDSSKWMTRLFYPIL